jgi:hypothetical protein
MGTLKLNNVTAITESGGTVTVDSAVAGIPAAGVTGTLTNAVQDNITRLGTVTAGSIAGGAITSATTFPTGHIIKGDILQSWINQSAIATNNTSFYNIGISGSITTLESSANSRLVWKLYRGMMYVADGTVGQYTMTMTSSSDTTYDAGDDPVGTNSYINYTNGGTHQPQYNEHHFKAGVVTPPNMTSYAAGATIYYRFWVKRNTGSNYEFIHGNSSATLTYEEIAL